MTRGHETQKNARYDLKAADRKRNLSIQIGLTAIVVIFAVGLVLYIVMSNDKKPASGEAKSIRVTSSNVIKKEGTAEPKAVLSLYEDFLCPHCGNFEQQFGPTVNKLIDTGAVAADYYMVAILDRQGDGTTRRAPSNAAYCVADESTDAFRRFHAALYAQQPEEGVGPFPDNARLIEVARQAGAGGGVPDCINKGTYVEMARVWPRRPAFSPPRPSRSTAQDYEPDARPTRWSPRSRRSSATCPASMPAPPAPAPDTAAGRTAPAPAP